MVGETGDKISSFDAMLSFLTWREALLKSREKKELTNQQGSEEAPNQVKEKSKKVLAEMKLLYPLEFAKSGDSSFLEDCVLKDILPQDKKSKNDQKEKIISQEIERKSAIIKIFPSEYVSKFVYETDSLLGQVFLNENLKNKIRACEDVEKFRDLDRDLNSNDISNLKDFVKSQDNYKTISNSSNILRSLYSQQVNIGGIFQESVLNPLNALYHTGLSALGAGIVSIANLCSTQQKKSPGVDIIKTSIEKLETNKKQILNKTEIYD